MAGGAAWQRLPLRCRRPIFYPMIRLAVIQLLLWPSMAFAMNWEGHDDWMPGFMPEFTLEAVVPGARPLPSPDCPVTPEAAAKNVYEQIPLPRHHCPAAPAKPATSH